MKETLNNSCHKYKNIQTNCPFRFVFGSAPHVEIVLKYLNESSQGCIQKFYEEV